MKEVKRIPEAYRLFQEKFLRRADCDNVLRPMDKGIVLGVYCRIPKEKWNTIIDEMEELGLIEKLSCGKLLIIADKKKVFWNNK